MSHRRTDGPSRPSGGWIRPAATGLSLAAHAAVALALFSARAEIVEAPTPQPVIVTLVQPPPVPEPAPAIGAPPSSTEAPAAEPEGPAPQPQPAPARAPRPVERPPVPAPAETPAPPTVQTEAAVPMPTLGAAQLAGALTAGSGVGEGEGGGRGGGGGTGGGRCDMVRRLQDALRNDPEIQAAAARAHRTAGADGRALLVWDGDWIREPGQEGKGLAGVRQAIAVEVGFSPRACRAEQVRGFVLISLSDGPNGPRIALGASRWRWSDLL